MGAGASVGLGSRVSESQAKSWCGTSFDLLEWARLLKVAKKSIDDGCVPVHEFLATCDGRPASIMEADITESQHVPQTAARTAGSAATHMVDVSKIECRAGTLATQIRRLRDSKYLYNLWRRINFKCHLNKSGELKLLQVERLVSVCPVWKFPKADIADVHYAFRNSCKGGRAMGTAFLQADAYVEAIEFPILVRDIVSRCLLNECIISRALDVAVPGALPGTGDAADATITLSLSDFAKLCAIVPGIALQAALIAGKELAVSLAMQKHLGKHCSQSPDAVEQRELLQKLMMDGDDVELKPIPVNAAFWSMLGNLVLPAEVAVAGMSAAQAHYETKKHLKRRQSRRSRASLASPKPDILYYQGLFKMYDIDNSNAIDADEIMTMLQTMGQTPDKAHVEGLIKEFDLNNNGELEIDEFIKMMQHFHAM